MSARGWFRCAAGLLLLFAVGHTVGFLTFRADSPAGQAVWDSMEKVVVANARLTYGGFYVGFGIFVTVFVLFTAWLAWLLGSMAERSAQDVRLLGWGLCLVQCVSLLLSLRYYAAPPAVLSGLAAGCFCLGALGVQKRERMA